MQFILLLVGNLVVQAPAMSLRAAPSPAVVEAPSPAPSSPKGVGDIKDFAHLLPYYPAGQQELVMKTRCVDFVNHLLEKGAYQSEVVSALVPQCKWTKAECKTLKDDLVERLKKAAGPAAAGPAPGPAGAAPTPAASLLQQQAPAPAPASAPGAAAAKKDDPVWEGMWLNGPRGPKPEFVTKHTPLNPSIYGWCDEMYTMMKKKAIAGLDTKEDAMQKRADAKKAFYKGVAKRKAALAKAKKAQDDAFLEVAFPY